MDVNCRGRGKGNVAVVLGTERLVDAASLITALVIDKDGSRAGFQDKVQIDPSEEVTYRQAKGGVSSNAAL